ncbi:MULTISPECIES: hypothetical protein [Bacillus cereus group]|uniref:hypothetical protein n=1 Tax=Bacillus cereus group TaxID=86661 RepID=UPI0001A1D749|nr:MULTISPECIES: hypothetical protein [Bacillus cereus group]EEM56529.1 hypothetical protein bthur0007_56250 [Bacillus thuringiensis serovar monterrey BGSC 4AJ1]MEB9673362.1 hypothetical protein [Bacillus anthracis]
MTVYNNNQGNDLNLDRKHATNKTRLIHDDLYQSVEWEKLKIEQGLAGKNTLVEIPLPIINGKNDLTPVWDLKRYFLLKDHIPDIVHPKLWEHGTLSLHSGLYKVTNRIYQVRGFDFANMSIIRGDTGWIV